MKYYPINEDLARRANEMNSFFEYVPGRATQSYRAEVDEAAALAERQKQRVDPMYHEKIDGLLDAFARKLADNINRRNEIATRVPSILVTGGSNFPVRKKEKQNQADAAAMEEYRQIRGLLDKIRGTGRGGISADDPAAVGKLKAKLQDLEALQDKMKAVNAYYRKHGTLDGCLQLSAEEVEKLRAGMARSWRAQPKPYESYLLTNNNASIRQVKARIEELTRQAETPYVGWEFDGGEVKVDQDANRLQVFFDSKPDRETCSAMRHGGFRWAPSVGAWQRQLNDNAIRAADQLRCIRPMFGYLPSELQEATHREQNRPGAAWDGEDWANWNQMSVEERIVVSFQKLIRQRFPDSEADGPAESEQTAELVRMLLNDGKRAANQMILTIAGLTMGSEVSREIEEQAGNLMASLARYRDSLNGKSVDGKSREQQGADEAQYIETVLGQMEAAQEVSPVPTGWRLYIIADLKTWADNAENLSPLEHFDSFEAAKARFDELRDQGYNSETVEPGSDGLPPARLTLGLESADGMSAADILHVRQGQNYLVTDFVRMERLRDDPQVVDILARVSREIGFDLVRVHEQTGEKTWTSTVVSFAEWDNPWFPAAAPGSIAARYHDLLRQCYPFSGDDTLRKAQVEEVVGYILKEGGAGAIKLSLVIDGVAASCPNNADVQKLATELVNDLVQYSASERAAAPKQKAQHEKPRER